MDKFSHKIDLHFIKDDPNFKKELQRLVEVYSEVHLWDDEPMGIEMDMLFPDRVLELVSEYYNRKVDNNDNRKNK